jgi:hypothetical protein
MKMYRIAGFATQIIMSNSLYNQTVPVSVKYLENLSHILDKAESFCKENGRNPDDIIQLRLIEDMRGY